MSRRNNGTHLDERTLQLPEQATREEMLSLYTKEVGRVGLSIVGDVFIEIQPNLFIPEVDVTYRARLGPQEREP